MILRIRKCCNPIDSYPVRQLPTYKDGSRCRKPKQIFRRLEKRQYHPDEKHYRAPQIVSTSLRDPRPPPKLGYFHSLSSQTRSALDDNCHWVSLSSTYDTVVTFLCRTCPICVLFSTISCSHSFLRVFPVVATCHFSMLSVACRSAQLPPFVELGANSTALGLGEPQFWGMVRFCSSWPSDRLTLRSSSQNSILCSDASFSEMRW